MMELKRKDCIFGSNKFLLSVDILDPFSGTDLGLFKGRTVWQLNKPMRILINKKYWLIIPAMFQTDLASVPRIPIVYALWGNRAHKEAIWHDYLYRTNCGLILARAQCDYLFKLAMVGRGQPWYIYRPMYRGVRLGGGSSYHQFPVDHKFIK